MKNFSIILFLFFILFLIISLYSADLLWVFLTVFLSLFILIVCLNRYLGFTRGLIMLVFMIVLPFIIEYLFWKFKLPLFNSAIIDTLTLKKIDIPVNTTNLFYIFTVPLLFVSSFFFARKIKIFTKIKKYHNSFIVIAASLIASLSFIISKGNFIDLDLYFKWLIIALASYSLSVYLFKFKPEIPEIYKELPIIIYLAIFGTNALKTINTLNLVITMFLIVLYLIILYQEYKIRKIAISS